MDKINFLRKSEKTLSVLGNTLRLRILYLLMRQNKRKLNFIDIAKNLDVDKNKLAYHIALLKNNQFISNEMRGERDGRKYSYYGITDKGKKALYLLEKIESDFKKDKEHFEEWLNTF